MFRLIMFVVIIIMCECAYPQNKAHLDNSKTKASHPNTHSEWAENCLAWILEDPYCRDVYWSKHCQSDYESCANRTDNRPYYVTHGTKENQKLIEQIHSQYQYVNTGAYPPEPELIIPEVKKDKPSFWLNILGIGLVYGFYDYHVNQ